MAASYAPNDGQRRPSLFSYMQPLDRTARKTALVPSQWDAVETPSSWTRSVAPSFVEDIKRNPDDEEMLQAKKSASKPSPRQPHSRHQTQVGEESMVPWIISPAQAWNPKTRSFSPRQEASVLELFFDLFFVANLATFTQNHTITNWNNFISYIAFFFMLWITWFHVVCFDARFGADSVWERTCKTLHFCTFAAFALVGYKYHPSDEEAKYTPPWIYRVLCWTFFASRLTLGIQYSVATWYCSRGHMKRHGLLRPLLLSAATYFVSTAVFGGLWASFPDTRNTMDGDISAVYSVLTLEVVAVIAIASIWTQLSFRTTHIAERLGLLGLIIIGEGVIGTTKTTTRIMGRTGVYFEGLAMVLCIVLILTFIWTIYFDNLPKYRFGAIKQQFWMILHFPLHLSVLGVVEGMQHIALARYISTCADKLASNAVAACVMAHLDGVALRDNLTANFDGFGLGGTSKTNEAVSSVYQQIYLLGNETRVCSPRNTTLAQGNQHGIPSMFHNYFRRSTFTISDGEIYGFDVTSVKWIVVYTYFWGAIMLLFFCLTASSLLADRGQFHWKRFRWAAVGSRTIAIVFAGLALGIGCANTIWIEQWLSTSLVLPVVVMLFCLVCIGDRFSRATRIRSDSILVAGWHGDGKSSQRSTHPPPQPQLPTSPLPPPPPPPRQRRRAEAEEEEGFLSPKSSMAYRVNKLDAEANSDEEDKSEADQSEADKSESDKSDTSSLAVPKKWSAFYTST